MKKITPLTILLGLAFGYSFAQNAGYWQQEVHYKMQVKLNDADHQFDGHTDLTYTNNSSDTLREIFFHLYFNAFQPGSDMDIRSLWIDDPDPRVTDRISKLTPEQCGQQHVQRLTLNGKKIDAQQEQGTIVRFDLSTQPILPHQSAQLSFDWNGQVPIQIRRSGRDNAEGVDYSMAQWYPKICAYDKDGWHPNPYVGREFF